MCNALRLDDMHASLPDVKYRSPLLMIHRHRVPLFAFQSFICSFDALAHSCDSHHSDVSVVPILGCPRQLLLSLFIKLDSAPKCGVTWFIMNELNLSFIFLDYLENCSLIDFAHRANTYQDCQSVLNLPQVETIFFKYILSPVFLETI